MFGGDVSAWVLVTVDDGVGLPAPARHRDRDDLVGEPAGVVRGDRALMRPHRELVLLIPADAVLPAQVLGGLDHAARNGMVCAACGFASPVEPVLQRDGALAHTGAQAQCVVLDIGHRLGAACDHDAGRTGGHLTRGVQHRLQTGAAAPVDLQSGHTGAQTGVECGDAADGRGLATGIPMAEDDVVDVAFAQSNAVGERAQRHGGEVGRGERCQGPAHPPDRGADGAADHDRRSHAFDVRYPHRYFEILRSRTLISVEF